VAELLVCSAAELCWNFNATREQFRISGNMTVVGDSGASDPLSCEQWPNHTGLPLPVLHEQRLLAWHALSDAARASYLYIKPPTAATTTSASTTAAHSLAHAPLRFATPHTPSLYVFTPSLPYMWPQPGVPCSAPSAPYRPLLQVQHSPGGDARCSAEEDSALKQVCGSACNAVLPSC
jgi:hypothetical protein